MRWNIGPPPSVASTPTSDVSPTLPPSHPPIASSSRHPPAQCPIVHDPSFSSRDSLHPMNPMNPLNNIPSDLGVHRAPGQKVDLPVDREASTIPRPRQRDPERGDGLGEEVWEYPSPQQFYNALVRKGWETPEESMEMVVAIHNFLNERAWEEVMKWERRLPNGEAAQLARFQGKPGELSPKARMHLWMGKLFPEHFNTMPPFDRHDWIVTRPVEPHTATRTTTSAASDESSKTTTAAVTLNNGTTSTTGRTPSAVQTSSTRYVIDYYSAPPDNEGNPVFHLDVRPAIDSMESVNQRVRVGLEEWLRSRQAV